MAARHHRGGGAHGRSANPGGSAVAAATPLQKGYTTMTTKARPTGSGCADTFQPVELHAGLAHAARVTVLGQRTASIVHEVSQPLATITLTTAGMLRCLASDTPDLDALRDLARIAAEQAARAAEVLGRVRAMARRAEPARRPIDLNALTLDGVRFLHHELVRHGVQAETYLDPANPAVEGDGVQLHQVLVNLALNAMQAMDAAASEPRRLRIGTVRHDDHVAWWVEDTGPGIAPGHEDLLFDSFHTTKPDGMGIGLSISQAIVHAHGGTLRLAAPRDEWRARFVVELPLRSD